MGTFTLDPITSDLLPSSDQSALISKIRSIYPSIPADANTVYLVFVGNFSSGDRGQSFPDGWNPPASARNFAFIAGYSPSSINYTIAHETGHLLLNQTAADKVAGGHYTGSHFLHKLMRSGTSANIPRLLQTVNGYGMTQVIRRRLTD